jgi:hypothetical protein
MSNISIEEKIRNIITKNSYLTIDELMKLALSSEKSSYYVASQPLGKDGDFITAPELSQMFGEMLSLWCVDAWQKVGGGDFNLVELGPGTGSLMVDILRTTKVIAPEFFRSISALHLLEINHQLTQIQIQKLLPFGIKIKHHQSICEIDKNKNIIIANEFFDALPVKQYKKINSQKISSQWSEVVVKQQTESNELYFDTARLNSPMFLEHSNAEEDGILEVSYESVDVMKTLCNLIADDSGAILIIDYGYDIDPLIRQKQHYASTLQAMKNHKFSQVLDSLGSADLTCHVDFHSLKQVAIARKLEVYGAECQRAFLQKFGISLRLQNLITQNPQLSGALINQYKYLVDTMGDLFKVLSIYSTND